jgi:hypothetical protein
MSLTNHFTYRQQMTEQTSKRRPDYCLRNARSGFVPCEIDAAKTGGVQAPNAICRRVHAGGINTFSIPRDQDYSRSRRRIAY